MSAFRIAVFTSAVALFAGCAVSHDAPPTPAPTSASVARPLEAGVDPAATLQPDSFDAARDMAVAEAERVGGSSDHSAHAGEQETQVLYVCPMHPEVTSNAPGTCPKCGMDLVRKGS